MFDVTVILFDVYKANRSCLLFYSLLMKLTVESYKSCRFHEATIQQIITKKLTVVTYVK